MNLLQRFWDKVETTDDCWIWTGARNNKGYGHIRLHNACRGAAVAHRIAYVLTYGSIPEDKQLDHVCHNRACVRPTHLRPVTGKQNQEHQVGARRNNRSSGVRGVTRSSSSSSNWAVRVGHNGEKHYGGTYATIAEAEKAAIALRNRLFTHNDHDRLVNA